MPWRGLSSDVTRVWHPTARTRASLKVLLCRYPPRPVKSFSAALFDEAALRVTLPRGQREHGGTISFKTRDPIKSLPSLSPFSVKVVA